MAASYSFRKSLNGFNREDVVRHLEYLNTRHANQINQYKADLEAKEQELKQLRALVGVQEQLAELQVYCAALEQEKTALQVQLEEEKSQRAAVVNRNEEELEAYRRAEQVERQAQQRAEQLCTKATGIVAEAGDKVDASAQRIGAMAQQVAQQLAALQQEVLGGKDALQDASDALAQLRAEDK